jgi:16S rRNA (cytosine1402-N4)-methyltransferase
VSSSFNHTSVLLSESVDMLALIPGSRIIDCTLGGGGHAERILELTGPDGALLGIDADPAAVDAARIRLARFGDRVRFANTYFDDLDTVARSEGFEAADGILFDLGVSSPQIDTPERGFSFQADAPLDMRFGPAAVQSAGDLVNSSSEGDLERIFREYGEERYARRIARAIVDVRRQGPITSTAVLAGIVARAKPYAASERIHPATRVFQALRIAVNDELGRLRHALDAAVQLLRPGGRLVVISFHSLEDRIVKQVMRDQARGCMCPPQVPVCICHHTAALRIVTRKPVEASAAEVAVNPRARSAKLRAAERL